MKSERGDKQKSAKYVIITKRINMCIFYYKHSALATCSKYVISFKTVWNNFNNFSNNCTAYIRENNTFFFNMYIIFQQNKGV